MRATIATAVIMVLLVPFAAAAPQLADAEGDCALPYGGAYLDLAEAWVDGEDASSFRVNLRLAAFDARLAEGAGYTVQFEHQGLRWGAVAVHRPVSDGGWSFYTGQAEAEEIAVGSLVPAEGGFEGTTLHVRMPKSLFPHTDPDDATLRGFWAASADLRPAYPFLLATDRVVPGSSNGRWLLCDEAEGAGVYAFGDGAHAAGHGAASASREAASSDTAEAAPADPPPEPRRDEVPGGGAAALLVAAGVAGALARRRLRAATVIPGDLVRPGR